MVLSLGDKALFLLSSASGVVALELSPGSDGPGVDALDNAGVDSLDGGLDQARGFLAASATILDHCEPEDCWGGLLAGNKYVLLCLSTLRRDCISLSFKPFMSRGLGTGGSPPLFRFEVTLVNPSSISISFSLPLDKDEDAMAACGRFAQAGLFQDIPPQPSEPSDSDAGVFSLISTSAVGMGGAGDGRGCSCADIRSIVCSSCAITARDMNEDGEVGMA